MKRQKSYSLERAKQIIEQYQDELIGIHPHPSVLHTPSIMDDYLSIEPIQELRTEINEQTQEGGFWVIAYSKNDNGEWKREINDLLFDLGKITELIP